jgi:hypothetical protein
MRWIMDIKASSHNFRGIEAWARRKNKLQLCDDVYAQQIHYVDVHMGRKYGGWCQYFGRRNLSFHTLHQNKFL